jgi:hypothetical protein
MPSEILEVRTITIGLHSNGCGHTIVMSPEHYEACRESGRSWYCTVCGKSRCFTGETELQKLRRERDAAKQREETIRANLEDTKRRLSAQFGENTKLRKRIKNGVCPCCTRSFTNLRRHLQTKHPEYAAQG